MGGKFKKRFRGLCPCTKTSPTPEVECGGKGDTGLKIGEKDNKPKPQTDKARPQSLSKFNQMILEIEAMYANITDKLDQRHKSLEEYAKFIFGYEYTNTTVKDDASVIANQSKCDTSLREDKQEIKHTNNDSQYTGKLQSLEEKERKDNNKDKEKSKRPTFSDRILYRWMTNHLQASNENGANVVETPSKTAGSEIINDEKPTHDEIGPVVYVIDRVFMVDPRIGLVTEVQKAGNPGDVYMGSVHKKGKSFNVEKANGAWRFQTIPARVSDFTISQEKYQVERIVPIANTLESHYFSDRLFIADYHHVHRTVAERNKPLNPLLTSQRVEMHGNGQQMIVSLAFGHQTQTHLQATLFGKTQLVQISVPIDMLGPMFCTKHHIHISTALSQPATANHQDQIHIYKQLVQIVSAFIHRFSLGPKAKMHDSKEVIQIFSAVNHLSLLSRPDHIPGYTQARIISLEFGQQVPIGVRDQIPGHNQVVILSIAFGQPASLDFRAQRPRIKDQMNLSVTPFDRLVQICPRAQLPGNRQLMQTFQSSDNHSQMCLQTRISGYNKQVMQISAPFGFHAAVDPGVLVSENTTRMQIFKHVMQISLATSQPSPIGIQSVKPGTKQQMKIFTTSGQLVSIGLRAQMPSTDHLKQKFQAVSSLAPIDLRAQKPEILSMGIITPAVGQLVSSNAREQIPGNEKYGQICQADSHLALTCLKTLTPGKDGMGEISVVGSPLLTRLRVQKPRNTEQGQHSIALECVLPTGLQIGTLRSIQIVPDHLAIDHIDAIAQRSHEHKTQMGQIVLATNGELGHLSLPFGQHSQTSLRTKETESDDKGQITMAFDCRAPFHQQAPKLGYKQPGQICVAFRHPTFTRHRNEQTWMEPMTQISLVSGHFPLFLKIGKGHLGQIFLTSCNRSQITQGIQQVGNTQLRQIFLALSRMPLTSFFAQISGNTNLGKNEAQHYFALTGLRADTSGAVLQTCSAFDIDASTSMSAPNIHIPNISGYISLMSSRSTFAILKEDTYPWPNVEGCRTSTAVETLTRPNIFDGKISVLAVDIVFKVPPARDSVFSLEMERDLPIRNILGPSHRIGELSSLETATRQPSVGPDIDTKWSSKIIGQSATSYTVEGKLTTGREADTIRISQVMAKPVNIKRPKGIPTTKEIQGMFGQWRLEDTPAGLKHVFLTSPAIEDISMMRSSRNTVKWDSYFTWKPTAKPNPDRIRLCLAADLVDSLDNNVDEASADADVNTTSVTKVRSISIGTTIDNKDRDDADSRETTRVRDPDNRKGWNTSHNGDLCEDKTTGTIHKTNSRRSSKEMQDKSTDTTDLHRFSSTAPVVSEVPVPRSTFGRFVFKHEVVGNLQDLMDRGARFDESHAKFLCINLLGILNYLLTRGMIHTNICPRNVSFDEFGYPCLTGYDKCILIGSDTRTRRKFRPIIEYCSPEQAMKTYVTEATDVFSVGVLCFNVVYGRPPHQGRTYKETRDNIINNNFIPKFEPDGLLSKSGKFFLVSCIRKDLDKRFSVRKCGTTLITSVKWFNDYEEEALLSHTMPSPFLQLLKD